MTPKKKAPRKLLYVPPPEERQRTAGLTEWVPDWPCAGGQPSRSAWIRQRLAPPLEVLWRTKFGTGARFAPIVTQDGVVYAADLEGALFAVDAGTGELESELRTSPISEGSPLWPLVAQGVVPRARVPISSPPAVAGWQLFFGDDEGIFYGFRRGESRASWRKAAPLSLQARRGCAYQAPLVTGGVAYTLDADGNLYGADMRSGRTELSLYLRGHPTAALACVQRRLLAVTRPAFPGEPSRLHAIETGGARLWHRDLPAPATVLGANAKLVVAGGALGVRAFSLSTGSPRWTVETPGGAALVGNLAMDLRCAYLATHDTVFAVELETGEVAWRASKGATSGLAVAGGVLWATAERALLAWDAREGVSLPRTRAPTGAVGGPTIALGRVFLATGKGELLALGLASKRASAR